MQQSDSIAALAAALAKAQATVEGALKGKVNPAFKSNYADLASIWDACREQLTANGLSVVQFPGEVIEGRMTLTTQLSHESGEWMRATMAIPLAKIDPQGAGSAITYARRYALMAVVGVSPEDDDGNAASQRQPARQEPLVDRINDEERHQLITLIEATKSDAKALCTNYRVDSLATLSVADFRHASGILKKRLQATGAANGNAAH